MFLDSNLGGLITLIAIISAAAIIGIVAFLLHRFMHPKLKDDGKPNEEQIVEEELNRILQPVEDEETAKQINNYKDDEE